jgi:hypothetical protein
MSDAPISPEGNALGSSLVLAAPLEKLVAKGTLGGFEAEALGSGPTRNIGETDAARLLDSLISRFAAKNF